MRTGPCEISRLEQIRMSATGECIGLVAILTGSTFDPVDVGAAKRLAYIKQVFDLCDDDPPVPYRPPDVSRMQWGDLLDKLVERFGDEHLCPECGYLLDVPTYQRGEIVCLRDGCGYRLRKEGNDGLLDCIDSAGD